MPLSVSSAPKQLSDGNSVGTILGRSSSDLIGFYGVNPGVSQSSGAAQSALSRGVGGGMIATDATSAAPTPGVTAQSTIEFTMTIASSTQVTISQAFALQSTDFVFVNKPTQQAGIAVGNVRVSGAQQVAVAFANYTAATVTPTANETYGIVAVRGLPFITQTITPASVSAATATEQLFTVTGVRVGEVVAVMAPSTVTNVQIAGVRVAAANQIGITFANTSPTTATVPPAGQYTIWSTGGVDAASNVIEVQANPGNIGGPTGSTASAVSFTLTGLTTSDVVMGVSKPTAQAGFMYGNGFVSAANLLGVAYTNFGPTVTPTSFETYGVSLWRPNPAAPIVTYSPTLTPAAVPPNTTVSQAFTVTGIVNSSMVWVNPPSVQPGIGMGAPRVSGTNQIELTFINATAATATPPAGVYAVANFQQPVPDRGSTWIYQVTPQMQQMAILNNAIRSALVANGMLAGA